MKKSERDLWAYARCIDCDFFGHHGAHCDIARQQVVCFFKACVFFQWRQANVLREMAPVYFWPHFEHYMEEIELRGMLPEVKESMERKRANP